VRIHVLVTCEHGGNRLPRAYRKFFPPAILATHRGYDPGALDLARDFAAALKAKLYYGTLSRLLIELNRTLDHPQLFSKYALRLGQDERELLIRRMYLPYWNAIERNVARALARGHVVVHVSSHSFTPRLNGVRRDADVGLLFDPARREESALCAHWYRALRECSPRLSVRNNYPYVGTGNGLTTALRGKYAGRTYVGVQIEVNQRFPRAGGARWHELRRTLTRSLVLALADWRVARRPRA
jgi:predicted N-formylglutamate amidohydrolase